MTEFENYLEREIEELQEQAGGGGESPMAAEFATEEIVDPIGGGTMKVLVFPEEQTALAIKIEGDAFPRIILGSDSSDGIVMGDGSSDPYASGAFIGFGGLGGLTLQTPNTAPVRVRGGITAPVGFDGAGGFQIESPNSTIYRIKVADDGTLSTEVVT